MHTTTAPFTLDFWKQSDKGKRHQFGWQGTSQEFGDIRVTYPLAPSHPEMLITEVRGGSIPTATFEARGIHTSGMVMPSLNRATLRLGDAHVHMTRNRLGVTHQGRSLFLKHAGDTYRLAANNHREYVLSRAADDEDPGVTITVRETGRGSKKKLTLSVAKRAVGADIALAALFAGVDRATLTRRGAVRAGIARVTHLSVESQY
ncbi:hypothetical protein [Streptomyces silvensis]|uniref:Uncharacterized protein n=1 Tax=Streptomyces silvensis TaxID=1765722 RepID=A0A0W7X2X6_9ACTN|nr:hypothetical protein [Streptomyces silvensis]KUF17135.1 hypothetical protein AT728_14830 [Streptomyces silvensis]